jgi:hypothetical protein
LREQLLALPAVVRVEGDRLRQCQRLVIFAAVGEREG